MSNKALLIILDGWGLGDHKKDDAIYNTPTPYIDSLNRDYPTRNCKQAVKMWDCQTDKWATPKWDT